MSNSIVWLTTVTDVSPPPVGDPLLGPRAESYQWRMLSGDGAPMGDLDGVEGATLNFSIFTTIRGGGTLDHTGLETPDWNKIRLQPWITVEHDCGTATWPLGVFIPAAPAANWDDGDVSRSVELYDKLLILDQDMVEETYAVQKGEVVTDRIKALILSAGEDLVAVEDSAEVLRADTVWEAGTTKLKIVNDLLESINYFSLWCDGYGAYRADPYIPPASRPISREFLDDENGIYSPSFEHDQDTFLIPNKMIVKSRSDGEDEGMTAVATNMDPEDPFSYPSRGRWITRMDEDVEASSQAVLNAIAVRRLRELSQASSSLTIKTALVPLDLNSLVKFSSQLANLDLSAVVQKLDITCTPGTLVTTTLSEVRA